MCIACNHSDKQGGEGGEGRRGNTGRRREFGVPTLNRVLAEETEKQYAKYIE